jgi:uncharacterized protein (TIGR03067 family)
MKSVVLLMTFWLVLSLNRPAGSSGKAETPIEGIWIIESATWCGEPFPLFGKELKPTKKISWSFTGKKYKSFAGGPEAAFEEGTFRVDSGKSPKYLDLMPIKGELLTTRKCLYALEKDELKIAFSLWFAPGTPEDEIKEGKKMRATRPKSLAPNKEDLTIILTLKRLKK